MSSRTRFGIYFTRKMLKQVQHDTSLEFIYILPSTINHRPSTIIFTTPALPLFHPVTLLCTWFGSGLVKRAPGTFGSLATLPVVWPLHQAYGMVALMAFSGFWLIAGTFLTNIYLKHTRAKDPKEVVIDEVAGQSALLVFMPPTLTGYAIGFVLFRLFDIVKPWPISWYDRTQTGGCAVMMDDIYAAFYPVVLAVAAVALGNLLGYEWQLGAWLY